MSIVFLLALALAQADADWPRPMDAGGGLHLTIYQPQVERWVADRIEVRSAVIATQGQDTTPHYGIVKISARTDVDRETRMVTLEDVAIAEASFPAAPALQPAVLRVAPQWPRTVSLDQLLASMQTAGQGSENLQLKNDPPRILFRTSPAVLIVIDGEPVLRPVAGAPFERVINTPALLFRDPKTATFYLDGQSWWMMAKSLDGPWTSDEDAVPDELYDIRLGLIAEETNEPSMAAASSRTKREKPPAVIVSTVPAELLVTEGEPKYAPLSKTHLLYVTNSGNDIFLDTKTQWRYTLLSGRWFRAKDFQSAWEWAPGDQLPRDFHNIEPDSPKGHVLASIPGTEQAREAVLANQIPQTATVKRAEAKFEARYEGRPDFRSIEGTNLQYATNTASEVIRAEGRYYAIENGIWFVADGPEGPWAVAGRIPPSLDTIPPSSPLFHVRYATIYRATPDVVYVGYTPGYLGSYVSGGVVVFGTGWRYPGSYCGPLWCGWPWTWGLGFRFSYWSGGWFWRPQSHRWWYHSTPAVRRVFHEHWNPHWTTPGPTWVRGNVNVYSRWNERVIAPRPAVRPVAPPAQPKGPDLYAGRDGNVYERRPNGWYRQDGAAQWQKSRANPQLETERSSRMLGQSRQREFEKQGHAPGVPRTSAPPPRRGGKK